MPRKGKGGGHGGTRTGTPGTAYPQRTDLNTSLPVQTAPSEGRDFGAVARDERAQREVPLRPPPSATAGVPNVPGPAPGELTGLNAPTRRPNQPLTDGVDIGPGRGPEALMSSPRKVGSRLLQRAADETGDPFLTQLAARANTRS